MAFPGRRGRPGRDGLEVRALLMATNEITTFSKLPRPWLRFLIFNGLAAEILPSIPPLPGHILASRRTEFFGRPLQVLPSENTESNPWETGTGTNEHSPQNAGPGIDWSRWTGSVAGRCRYGGRNPLWTRDRHGRAVCGQFRDCDVSRLRRLSRADVRSTFRGDPRRSALPCGDSR